MIVHYQNTRYYMRTPPILFLLSSSLLLLFSCTQPTPQNVATSTKDAIQLGDLDLKVTGAAIAQPKFEEALLLLHSFEYEDARAAFLETQRLDSTFAMAYWGEAMTYNHSLWQRQEKDKAIAALNKLAVGATARKALIKTELEQDFFNAAELLFGEGTKYDRDLAYKDFMEGLTKKYPTNHEVSALYAISLLGSSRNGRNEALYEKSAKIAQGIIKENPNHPGALHYMIHSYDDPVHAHLAKNAADSYAKVAPDAAHALHMPSHIYVALGLWDEVVTSNIASWNASIKKMKRKGLESGRSYHAFNWLQYGLLQRGEVDKATNILQDMVQYKEADPSKTARGYLVAMKGAQMVETNTWAGEIANIPIKVTDLSLTKRAAYAFLEGRKAYHQKDATQLQTILKEMEKDRLKSMNLIGEEGFAMCSAGGFANKPPNQLDIDMVHVMEMELQAYLATLQGATKEATNWFEKATKLDEGLNYSFGPPVILKPVHEAYAEWLLEQNQSKKALAVFEKALERQPLRLLSLQGKKQAALLLKKQAVVAEVEKELSKSLAKKERRTIL